MSPKVALEPGAFKRLLWKVATGVVTVASLGWVGILLMHVWPDLATHSSQIQTVPLALAFVVSLVASYIAFEAFVTLVQLLNIAGLPRRELAHLHFTSQLLKHLPGRVWGVGYQWAAGNTVGSLRTWLLINTGQMLFATFFALWGAWLVLGFQRSVQWGVVALFAGVTIYIIGWLSVASRRLSGWLRLFPGRFGKISSEVLDVIAKTPGSSRIKIFIFFSIASVLYYVSWFLNGMAYPSLGGGPAMQLGALYMVAWFVGYVSLLTPSGLGIRELAFVWLAKDFSGDAVALMAVIGRVSLLAVDLVMGLIFAPFVPRKS